MSTSVSGRARDRAGAPSQQARPGAPSALARFRQRHPMLSALIPVGLVLVAVATMVIIKTTGGSAVAPHPASASNITVGTGSGDSSAASNGTTALPAGVLAEVTTVSPTALAAVGAPSSIAPPTAVPGSPTLLRAADGKPDILYLGAEYCPFCAAQRWAMVVALSRFGTFSGLAATHSSTTDNFPDTQTFSFYGSTYTSPYLDFNPVELETNQRSGDGYATLQTPTAAEVATEEKYDTSGSIPFLDIGNRYLLNGASYTPQILQGLSLQQIAGQLDHPNSVVATAIDGTANEITAAICSITGGQPASVCTSPSITAIMKTLGS